MMIKMCQRLGSLLLMCCLLIGGSIYADDVSTPAESEPPTETVQAIRPLALTVGDGSEANPWLVGSIADLTDALKKSIPAGSTALYIKLTADLTYRDMASEYDRLVDKNIVLDGDNHFILYNGTNYERSLFRTNANNLTITLKNLKWGNVTYPDNSYWGMVYTANSGVNLIIENIDYNIQKGCQPFYGNDDTGTLTFKGTNTFKSVGNDHGGEFVERIRTVNFADNSKTTVYSDSTQESAMFWCGGNLKINIGKNATLDMTTSKPDLVYDGGAAEVSVAEKGKFLCKFIKGTNYTAGVATRFQEAGSSFRMTFGKDSIGHFSFDANRNNFSNRNVVVIANSTNYIVFESLSKTKSVMSGIFFRFMRDDIDTHAYSINYLKQDGTQGNITQNASGGVNIDITTNASSIGNAYSVAYARAPEILSIPLETTVGRDVSKLGVKVDGVYPTQMPAGTNGVTSVDYKLATRQLFSGNDITTAGAQASIEAAKEADGVHSWWSAPITTDIEANSAREWTRLAAGIYWIYAKLESQYVPGYTLTSPWIGQVVQVPEHIEVDLPDAILFDSPQKGAFGDAHNLDSYTVSNHSNVPVNLDVKYLTTNQGSSPNIGLVDSIFDKKQMNLNLVVDNARNGNRVVHALLDSTTLASKPIRLEPAWDRANFANLYAQGEHSVSLLDNGPHRVSYNLSVSINPIH